MLTLIVKNATKFIHSTTAPALSSDPLDRGPATSTPVGLFENENA